MQTMKVSTFDTIQIAKWESQSVGAKPESLQIAKCKVQMSNGEPDGTGRRGKLGIIAK